MSVYILSLLTSLISLISLAASSACRSAFDSISFSNSASSVPISAVSCCAAISVGDATAVRPPFSRLLRLPKRVVVSKSNNVRFRSLLLALSLPRDGDEDNFTLGGVTLIRFPAEVGVFFFELVDVTRGDFFLEPIKESREEAREGEHVFFLLPPSPSFSRSDSMSTVRLNGLMESTNDLIVSLVAGESGPFAVKKSILKCGSTDLLPGETVRGSGDKSVRSNSCWR